MNCSEYRELLDEALDVSLDGTLEHRVDGQRGGSAEDGESLLAALAKQTHGAGVEVGVAQRHRGALRHAGTGAVEEFENGLVTDGGEFLALRDGVSVIG